MGKSKLWTEQEDKILIEQYQNLTTKKWVSISSFFRKNNINKTPSECRERYINFLAPNISKQPLSTEELKIIYDLYEKYGPKWNLIQKQVRTQTQCRIKNLFYGLIKNCLKTIYKYFTGKTSVFFNEMKTDDLQQIYDHQNEFEEFQIFKESVRFIQFKSNKSKLFDFIRAEEKKFLALINRVLQYKLNRSILRIKLNKLKKTNSSNEISYDQKQIMQKYSNEKKQTLKKQQIEQKYIERQQHQVETEGLKQQYYPFQDYPYLFFTNSYAFNFGEIKQLL